ncbi:glycosyltransferase family 2 protein [Bradyrhizobium sp. HKCCYLS2038]|uniref:glycosyltransferase family 2 protein n=1 Tax=unclassified Bradyrhizobium TaxID=2631580 RepID=UPI003EBCE727
MRNPAPVALFVYNRPAHTARTLQALGANPLAAATDLVVFADGPKSATQVAAVAETRAVVRAASGFRSLRLVEQPANLGLSRSITGGIAELCASAGRVIAVEDDLQVAPCFLEFLNVALDRYQNDERVLQISGYGFPMAPKDRASFLPIISCWGWATWARAWKHYDPEMTAFEDLRFDAGRRHRFNLDGAYDYWGMARSQRDGHIDSWGIRWQMSLFARDGLVLYPPASLVENTGVDSSGTHGAGVASLQRPVESGQGAAAWQWPSAVDVDPAAFDEVRALLRAQRPSFARGVLQRAARAILPRRARVAVKSILKPPAP